MAYKYNTKRSFNAAFGLMTVVAVLIFDLTAASQDVIPHPCDTVKCPPIAEISCPEDSSVDLKLTLMLGQLVSVTTNPHAADGIHNTTEIAEDLYAQCCLTKKCICKTCYIPSCHNDNEVVIELLPESMDMPGHCCGQYECQKEPNCTEVRDTDNYWLTDCQRCKCYTGERICHQSCDEGIKKPAGVCHSKNLSRFFEHGDTWKDGCQECECVNGEEKCVIPFCKSTNCLPHRVVILKNDYCCPVCWPKGIPMPNGDENYEDEDEENIDDDEDDKADGESGNQNYDDSDAPIEPLPHPTDDYADNEIDMLPNDNFDKEMHGNASKPVSTTTLAPNTTAANTQTKTTSTLIAVVPTNILDTVVSSTNVALIDASTETPPPCRADGRHRDAPSDYQVYPEVVEVVRQNNQNELLYAIIGFLALFVIILVAWNINLRAKQRSYRPVSNFDDNFNKMSSNIKKMNEYA